MAEPTVERRDLSSRPFHKRDPENADDAAKREQGAPREWQSTAAEPNAGGQLSAFQELTPSPSKDEGPHDIDLILDIPVQITVELGRTKVPIKNLLQLAQGSVVELDGIAGEPMDVRVNGCLIAQGEVVVENDKFGIRLTDIITPSERMRKLNR